LLVKL